MNDEINTSSYFQEMFDELTDLMRQKETCFDCEKLRKLSGNSAIKCDEHKERARESLTNQRSLDDILREIKRIGQSYESNRESNEQRES